MGISSVSLKGGVVWWSYLSSLRGNLPICNVFGAHRCRMSGEEHGRCVCVVRCFPSAFEIITDRVGGVVLRPTLCRMWRRPHASRRIKGRQSWPSFEMSCAFFLMRARPLNLCLNLGVGLACTAHRRSSLYEVYLKKKMPRPSLLSRRNVGVVSGLMPPT